MKEFSQGYFQFSSKEDGLYITVFPPKGDAPKATLDDILKYIDKRKIVDCNLNVIKSALIAINDPITVKVSENPIIPSDGIGDYYISSDCMFVEAKFFSPFEGANEMTEDEIIKDLQSIGIKYGIDKNVIQQFLKEKEYGKKYILANGVEPKEGVDGRIEYNFNVDLKPRPKVKEDGTVDFHSLENVNHINVGAIIAIIIPEDRGVPGVDVFNRPLQPKKVKKVVFRHGKNMKISSDGLQLISQVSGHVTLEDDKVFVSNVFELIDVDNSSGDIDYDGSIVIKGNVLAGFSVKATGNISVYGIIEGANIFAGGNITLNRGIQGMNRAVVQAGGDIVTKFIESAKSVVAGGSIDTDTILHSKVIAKGSIIAKGKNGLIVGGDVKSSTYIEAKTIGNEMGTATTVGVGVDPSIKKRIDELKKELEKLSSNKIQLNQILTALRKKQELVGSLDAEKQQMQQNTMRSMILLEQQLIADKKELDECRMELTEDQNARIKINKNVYVGTKFVFGESYLFIRENYSFCQFLKQGVDIKCLSL